MCVTKAPCVCICVCYNLVSTARPAYFVIEISTAADEISERRFSFPEREANKNDSFATLYIYDRYFDSIFLLTAVSLFLELPLYTVERLYCSSIRCIMSEKGCVAISGVYMYIYRNVKGRIKEMVLSPIDGSNYANAENQFLNSYGLQFRFTKIIALYIYTP